MPKLIRLSANELQHTSQVVRLRYVGGSLAPGFLGFTTHKSFKSPNAQAIIKSELGKKAVQILQWFPCEQDWEPVF